MFSYLLYLHMFDAASLPMPNSKNMTLLFSAL